MRECGGCETKRVRNLHLPRSIWQMVVAAHDMRDAEIDVIDNRREVVNRAAVGTHDYEIVQLRVLEHEPPFDEIVHDGLASLRHREANRVGAAGVAIRQRKIGWKIAVTALAIVNRLALFLFGRLALGIEFLRSAIAGISLALAQEVQGAFEMAAYALGLEVTLVGRTLVPFHPEPSEVRQLLFERFLSRTLAIGVIDSENELAATVARKKVGEQP